MNHSTQFIGDIFSLITFIILLIVGYTVGTTLEKKHFNSIKKREAELINLPLLNIGKKNIFDKEIDRTEMAVGTCVISIDYFKKILAFLQNLFGMRVSAYETLMDRARREAIIRMKQSFADADLIVNLRLENGGIGNKSANKQAACVDILAYATAIYYKK